MNESKQIRILIADDHAIVREGLSALFDDKPDMHVVGEAADGVEVVSKAQELIPDIILMDMIMPRLNGIEAIKQLQQENNPARILVLSSFAEDKLIFPAIKSGASGYLLKDSTAKELFTAIQNVYHGESSLHPTIARKLIGELREPPIDKQEMIDGLTTREIEILELVAKGFSNQKIGKKLTISDGTVGKHVSNILRKLHLASRTQAALFALREGLASLDEDS